MQVLQSQDDAGGIEARLRLGQRPPQAVHVGEELAAECRLQKHVRVPVVLQRAHQPHGPRARRQRGHDGALPLQVLQQAVLHDEGLAVALESVQAAAPADERHLRMRMHMRMGKTRDAMSNT